MFKVLNLRNAAPAVSSLPEVVRLMARYQSKDRPHVVVVLD
jgi:hypothetical protein